MIKIVEIKGGLKEYHEQKEFSFENKDFYFGKSRRKGFSGLYEQLVNPLRDIVTYGTEGGSVGVGYNPALNYPTTTQTNFISDPVTGNTEVRHNGQDFSFSRDMTEEQIIAYFDSLN